MDNGHATNSGEDHYPVVRLILPGTGVVFLLTEIDPGEPNIAFGLCDLGLGLPELGYVDLNELNELHTGDDYKVECDPGFRANHPLSVYTKAARYFKAITTDDREVHEQGNFRF